MIRLLCFLFVALLVALGSASARADADREYRIEKAVVAFKTGDAELTKTDVSHLGVGDAETVYTEDGRTVDILRTDDGLEIYLDGELLSFDGAGSFPARHAVRWEVEVTCDDGTDCDEAGWVVDAGRPDLATLHGQGHEQQVIVIRERVENN